VESFISANEGTYGRTSNLEGLPENQSGEHPHQGVSSDRIRIDDFLQSAARGVPHPYQSEEMVFALQS
jgi:hypothetical protein